MAKTRISRAKGQLHSGSVLFGAVLGVAGLMVFEYLQKEEILRANRARAPRAHYNVPRPRYVPRASIEQRARARVRTARQILVI